MICPNCHGDQSVTEGNYGALYTCKLCQAVYFINFEGQPEFSEVQEMASDRPPFPMDTPLDMGSLPPTNLPDSVAAATDPLAQISNPLPATNIENDSFAPLVQFNQNEFAVAPEPFQNLAVTKNQFSDIAKDISDYGNSETQIAHLNYDLRITGLDTAEVIGLLKEAIEDSRFGWDANEMMRTIKKGEMYFGKLSPVKAFMLAKRIQFLNVDKVWKQNAVG